MAEEKSVVVEYNDHLDILFEGRNKAYGAYQLRRTYPTYLGRALLFSFSIISVMVLIFYLRNSVYGANAGPPAFIEDDDRIIMDPPPDIKSDRAPVKQKKLKIEQVSGSRPSKKYTPPIVVKDNEMIDESDLPDVNEILVSKSEVGAANNNGNADAPPLLGDTPKGLNIGGGGRQVVDNKTYESFDLQKEPLFPGGERALLEYLSNHINYPEMAREGNIHGVVPISFVVNKDGSVSNILVLRDIGGGCGKEAARVVGTMPKWTPGEANGHKVKVRYTLPVRFVLQ